MDISVVLLDPHDIGRGGGAFTDPPDTTSIIRQHRTWHRGSKAIRNTLKTDKNLKIARQYSNRILPIDGSTEAITVTPRAGVCCTCSGREGSYAHAHYAVMAQFLAKWHLLCWSQCLVSFAYIAGGKPNVFGTECNVKFVPPRVYINSVALVRERTIPTERPPPVGEVSANFCG